LVGLGEGTKNGEGPRRLIDGCVLGSGEEGGALQREKPALSSCIYWGGDAGDTVGRLTNVGGKGRRKSTPTG